MDKTDFLMTLMLTAIIIIGAGVGYIVYIVMPVDEPVEDSDLDISPGYTIILDSVNAEYTTVFVIRFDNKIDLSTDAFTFYKNGIKLDVSILQWDGMQMICGLVTDAEHCGRLAYQGLEVRY